MKILFITDNFPPELNAPATRTIEHCKMWKGEGLEITVITCAPNFPQGKVYDGYKNRLISKEIVEGITVLRVWSYITRNKGFFKRILDYMSFGVSSFVVGLFLKYDLIIATSPQFFTTTTACLLSKIRRKPWIFELRDLWPESIKTVGAMNNSIAIRLLEKLELYLYKDADRVVAVTDAFKSRLQSRGVDPVKIDVVTNGANLKLFRKQIRNKELVDKLGLKEKFVVGYVGTHGLAHKLDFIIESINDLNDESFHFIFVGDGAMKNDLVEKSRDYKLNNITFLDPIEKKRIPDILSLIDVALVPLMKSNTFKTVIPSKIFESAAMEIPILLGVEGQAKDIVESYQAGICFEPENEKSFIDALMKLKEDESFYRDCQKGCIELANDFDRNKLAMKMLEIIRGVINEI